MLRQFEDPVKMDQSNMFISPVEVGHHSNYKDYQQVYNATYEVSMFYKDTGITKQKCRKVMSWG